MIVVESVWFNGIGMMLIESSSCCIWILYKIYRFVIESIILLLNLNELQRIFKNCMNLSYLAYGINLIFIGSFWFLLNRQDLYWNDKNLMQSARCVLNRKMRMEAAGICMESKIVCIKSIRCLWYQYDLHEINMICS